ncbi:tetratricopeptide repeat protein [Nakamurella leprariae]|uniref:Tetratricopeptide repeat protein n=1 Tax=Nakamurella leprariae TaxID=2803911 RepID=A0A938YDR5_9ACTN|nr:hypothetical protein [Nakamurella leprariae]MBM9465888.1 hypothetical protein [Nakamurella leprariae]
MSRAKIVVIVLAAVLCVYFWLVGRAAWTMMTSGEPVAIGLGIGIFLLPLIGALLMVQELRFGARTETLGRRLDAEGGLPSLDELPRRASGRVQRDAADAYFETVKQEVEAAPEDWRGWYRLSRAYELAGDRKRAREAMRRSIDLSRTSA